MLDQYRIVLTLVMTARILLTDFGRIYCIWSLFNDQLNTHIEQFLYDILFLQNVPSIPECYDISHDIHTTGFTKKHANN